MCVCMYLNNKLFIFDTKIHNNKFSNSSNKDLKRYYKIRTLYENNVEYEIGYVSQKIIHRYSHVLELFHQVRKLYDERPTTMFAPIKYVFNMYATVLEECKHIIHLCHMMNVIEKKYIAKTPDSILKEPVTVHVSNYYYVFFLRKTRTLILISKTD
ncbi:hypothetical protein K1T71_015215 [Dendrolimus kikuchii]|nr:hypothetical protein K1T71_015215 [Dendrolimus kikuchii]